MFVEAAMLLKETAKKGICETIEREKTANMSLERGAFFSELDPAANRKKSIDDIRADARLRDWNTVRTERRPEKVVKDVSKRLVHEGYTPEAWNRADVSEREALIRKAADVMSQEMLLPQEIREQIRIEYKELSNAYGETNVFIEPVEGSNTFRITGNPVITLDKNRLKTASGIENLGTLFHEMTHVLQEVSVTERRPWTENVSYWKKSIKEYGPFTTWSEYVTAPLEAYTHANTALFKKVYLSDSLQGREVSSAYVKKEASGHGVEAKNLSSLGNYESLMRECKNHMEKARNYERKANDLERMIQRKKADPSRKGEVNRLRRIAESEKREARQCQQEAARALRMRETDISFQGGLGKRNIEHLNGSSLIGKAESKRREAESLMAKATRMESEGRSGSDYRVRASSLRREADTLERRGKELMSR